jgi:hypothetical protein
MIYFDNNSTTRVFESTVEAMRPFLTENFANPASAIAQFGGIPQTIQAQKVRMCKALGGLPSIGLARIALPFPPTPGLTEPGEDDALRHDRLHFLAYRPYKPGEFAGNGGNDDR